MNAELAQLGPFLLDAVPDASVTLKEQGTGVEFSVVTHVRSRLFLLANPTETPREVTLQFASAKDGILKPVGRGSEITVAGGFAKVKLDANGAVAFQD